MRMKQEALQHLYEEGGLRADAAAIMAAALKDSQPDEAVQRALSELDGDPRPIYLAAVGKAAWTMAAAAAKVLGERLKDGVVITKYDHSQGPIPHCRIFEAGHPLPDENSVRATQEALKLVRPLGADDLVIFLVSGGGSALFEDPLIPLSDLQDLSRLMLAAGIDIVTMNTVRKRLSRVKAGRFAEACAPAHVFSIVLSDIIGDPLDSIASGPAYPDSKTSAEAEAIARRLGLDKAPEIFEALKKETPKQLSNVTTRISGSVSRLCESAEAAARSLGYDCLFLSDRIDCEAREAGFLLASAAKSHSLRLAREGGGRLAIIAGGETTVTLKGSGRGGRNQELALAAAKSLTGEKGILLFSLGSDGTDGPTDAAGGLADGCTWERIRQAGEDPQALLDNNDSYRALKAAGDLIITGPTGTNVNDLTVALVQVAQS